MELRTLGSSGALVSVWCLGTMTFGDEADESDARAIMDHYVEAGGRFLDTADVYAKGASEAIIGRWMASSGSSSPYAPGVVVALGSGRPETADTREGDASLMVPSILLVHSPLVGPSTWAVAAQLMVGRGFAVSVPDLTGLAHEPAPMWRNLVDGAVHGAAALTGDVAIVGHSGAGAFLPAIAGGLQSRAASLVFVDAVLPPTSGVHETPARLRELLDAQTVEGRLRRWLEWWPDDVVSELVPDADERTALLDDMPSLPRSFYDESVPVPDGWTNRQCAYLKLSDAYDAEFAEAGRRGWVRGELDSDHLAIRTQPHLVVDAVESLLDALT